MAEQAAEKNIVCYSTNPQVLTLMNYSGNITVNEIHKEALAMAIAEDKDGKKKEVI